MVTGEPLLCNDMKRPAVLGGELLGDGQLASDLRPRETIGRFDFHEPFAPIRHFNHEVGHDVTAVLTIAAFSAVRWRAVEQFDLDAICQLLPCIPDRQGLFLNMEDLWAGHERCGRGPFELALAADRSALFRTGHEQKRAGCTTPKVECRNVSWSD